ncbi:hypothetical protein AB835_08945 [Candidatus Endobugula sertula]|uniref:Acyloxyacyl hydrolase n=1 Tax=Candidatus Endobugula sertula TaxID=62101 RepID=A0A1D2QPB8_9GAMM|nr:hypothetical protein AB835_08945 [Candidatus Endobugula sertula]
MAQIFTFTILTLFCSSVFANPMFGEYQNQFSLSLGQSIRRGLNTEELFYADMTYSQPTTFFRRAARRNIELGGFKGNDCTETICSADNGYPRTANLSQYDLALFGLSGDVLLFSIGNFYTNVRLGAYIKSETTNRIRSAFTFGEKITFGYRMNRINLEFYARHFSNGTLTNENSGQNFYGLSIAINL